MLRSVALILATLLVMPLVSAQTPAAVEFSADIYQKAPKRPDRNGRIYVGKSLIRTEMELNGQVIITIIDSANQKSWVLNPSQRSYIEYRGEGDAAPISKGAPASPCQRIAGAVCKHLGEEVLQGRKVVKWDVQMPGKDRQVHSTQWIDRERMILIRQEIENGPRMEQRFIGVETLHSRVVEKWEQVVIRDNAIPQQSARWFDPELNLAIKEEHPGGYLREMRNIRVGNQSASLFTLPADYRKIQAR